MLAIRDSFLFVMLDVPLLFCVVFVALDQASLVGNIEKLYLSCPHL